MEVALEYLMAISPKAVKYLKLQKELEVINMSGVVETIDMEEIIQVNCIE